MDRPWTSRVGHSAPGCTAGVVPIERHLRAGTREPVRSGADAVHRRAVHAHALLRLAAYEGGAVRARVWGEPQAGAAADAPDGALGDRARSAHEPCPSWAQGLSLSPARCRGEADRHGRPRAGRAAMAYGQVTRTSTSGTGTVEELDAGLARYFRFYNEERPHQSLGYRTPAAVHGVKL